MIRRHLALSIALTTVLSLAAGGLAYAALAPDTQVTACVTSEGFVRSATFKNKCPYKSTPVELASMAELEKLADDVGEINEPPPAPTRLSDSIKVNPNVQVGRLIECPADHYVIDHSWHLRGARDGAFVTQAKSFDSVGNDGYPDSFIGSARNNQSEAVDLDVQVFCAPIPR